MDLVPATTAATGGVDIESLVALAALRVGDPRRARDLVARVVAELPAGHDLGSRRALADRVVRVATHEAATHRGPSTGVWSDLGRASKRTRSLVIGRVATEHAARATLAALR